MQQYINEIILDNVAIVQNDLHASYTVTLRRVEDFLFFSFVITLHDIIKISNYSKLFDIEAEVIKHLKSQFNDLNNYRYSIIVFFEFEKNIRFLPDLRSINYSQQMKADMEKKYSIKLDGVVGIFKSSRIGSKIKPIINFFLNGANVNVHLTDSLLEANQIWSEFIESKV